MNMCFLEQCVTFFVQNQKVSDLVSVETKRNHSCKAETRQQLLSFNQLPKQLLIDFLPVGSRAEVFDLNMNIWHYCFNHWGAVMLINARMTLLFAYLCASLPQTQWFRWCWGSEVSHWDQALYQTLNTARYISISTVTQFVLLPSPIFWG